MNETQAAALLAKMLQENAGNNYAGIDRSPEAVQRRKKLMDWSHDNPVVSALNHDDETSATAKATENHYANGDITQEQAVEILLTLYSE